MERQEFVPEKKAIASAAKPDLHNVIDGVQGLNLECGVEDVAIPRPDSCPLEENSSISEAKNKSTFKGQMKSPKNIPLSRQGATWKETSSEDISYEYFPAAINPGASAEELRYFYPERTVAFHSFEPFISVSRITEFVQGFGDVSVLKFLPSGEGLCAIAVFKERAGAFAATLYFCKRKGRGLPLFVEFICSADQNTIGGCEEISDAASGEEVSSNTVLTVLVPEDEDYAKVLRRLCVGEVREIALFPEEGKYSLMSIEFVEPLDAAISAYCAVDSKGVLSSFFEEASVRNKEATETLRVSTTFNKCRLVREIRYVQFDIEYTMTTDFDCFSENIELVSPSEIVRLSLRENSNFRLHHYHPVCFLNIPDPLEFIFIQVVNSSRVKRKQRNLNLFVHHLDCTRFVRSIRQAREYPYDRPEEITPWVSCFLLQIYVSSSKHTVGVSVTDMTYLFPKTCPQFFQKDIRNFAFVSPRNLCLVSASKIPHMEDTSYSIPAKHLQVEQTENGKIFVHVPYTGSTIKVFAIPFIFQYPDNFSGWKLRTSAKKTNLL